MSETYPFSVANDTASGIVNGRQLTNEIPASGITTTLHGIFVEGDNLDIVFVSGLPGPELTTLSGVVSAHDAVTPVFGWKKWEDNSISNTALETWQEKFKRTAPPLPGGMYRVSWNFELKVIPIGPLNSKASGRLLINGSPKGIFHSNENEWTGYSGWDFIKFKIGETPELSVEWRRDPTEAGNDSVEIRRVKMSLENMDDR